MNKHSRSKSGLFLMELIIVILFFSISAAICMRIFSTAKIKSDFSRDISNASVKAQNCAEAYKAYDANFKKIASVTEGNINKNKLIVYYDLNWEATNSKDNAKYVLTLENKRDSNIKETGKIYVEKIDGGSLFELTVKTARQKSI